MRIVIENSDYLAVGFHVPWREMHTAQSLARDRRIPRPEHRRAQRGIRRGRCRRAACWRTPHEEIADVLLHQEVLAGVGNVFKSEICFLTGINPFCQVAALSADANRRLDSHARRRSSRANVLEDSGDTIVTYRGQQRRTTHAIRSQREPVGLRPQRASPAAAAASRFAGASRARMRASPSGARTASPCPTAPM